MHRRRIPLWRALVTVVVLGLGPALAVPQAAAGAPTDESSTSSGSHGTYQHQLLAKATPDECFAGIGVDYPPGPPCAAGQPKANQTYVWGLTRAGSKLWFGSGPNVQCLTSGRQLNRVNPILNDDYVCEYGSSQVVRENPQLPARLGDHRQPDVFVYDLRAHRLTGKTDDIVGASPEDAQRLLTTAGIRAAGTHQGVVLLGGPTLGAGINLFAFNTDTGQYLGSTTLTKYGNIRHFTVADNVLYAGVGVGPNGNAGGFVLRWTGNRTNPFSFVEVGALPSQAANLTVHQGRIFTTTWAAGEDGAIAETERDPRSASVWMSPRLADGAPGLTVDDAAGWTQVWSVNEYEPDPIIASTYGLGALASYGGYLYWGTMHVPLKATVQYSLLFPPKDETEAQATLHNTQRASAIFRGRDFGGSHQKVELLYGASALPVFHPEQSDGAGAWVSTPVNYTARYGLSGFGNQFNNYTWAMSVVSGKLFIGTMDWSSVADELQNGTAQQPDIPEPAARALASAAAADDPPPPTFGGDLWVFDSPNKPATNVDNSGMGNYLNYGIRNMVTDGSALYLGMANPANLRTDLTDDVPEGGWELIKLTIPC